MRALGLGGRLSREGMLVLVGVLLAICAVTLPELGSDPWPFRPGAVDPQGILAPLVRAADSEWDVGIARTTCFLAAMLLGAVGVVALRRRDWPAWVGAALAIVVALMLMAPSTALQIGLRQSTAPWFFTNDSTYQVELSGDLLRHGHNPYGHDYRRSGMERFYTFDGRESPRVREREVALRHYAYFPGMVYTSAAWRILPAPLDDYRVLILLATLAGILATLAFRAPLSWKLAVGAAVVANPIAVRSAWFGQNDAPSLTMMLLAFGLAARGRARSAAAALAVAVLLKQFAVVAIPFIAVMLLTQRFDRRELLTAAGVFAGVIVAAMLPFAVADPGAFYDDTVKFGAGTYKVVGYGLSGILVRAGIVADRDGAYPFAPLAVLLWAPLTAWLCVVAYRAREQWVAAAGFAVSMLVLLYIGRTFNNYYLVWPATGAAAAALIYAGERFSAPATPAQPPASPRAAPS